MVGGEADFGDGVGFVGAHVRQVQGAQSAHGVAQFAGVFYGARVQVGFAANVADGFSRGGLDVAARAVAGRFGGAGGQDDIARTGVADVLAHPDVARARAQVHTRFGCDASNSLRVCAHQIADGRDPVGHGTVAGGHVHSTVGGNGGHVGQTIGFSHMDVVAGRESQSVDLGEQSLVGLTHMSAGFDVQGVAGDEAVGVACAI